MVEQEEAFIRSIVKHLDSLSFQPHYVGHYVRNMDPVMSERLAETFYYIVAAWDNVYTNNTREVPFAVAELGRYLMIAFQSWYENGEHTAGVLVNQEAHSRYR